MGNNIDNGNNGGVFSITNLLGWNHGSNNLVKKLTSKVESFFTLPTTSQNLRAVEVPTTSTGSADIAIATFNNIPLNIARDRKRVYFELKQMAEMDELVDTALDIYADCVTGYDPDDKDGFEWEFTYSQDDPNVGSEVSTALKILNDAKTRLELGSEVWKITRNFIHYGEEFREIVLDELGNVQRFKFLPSYQIWPNFDPLGNKTPGWEQRLDGIRPNTGIQFKEWQIIPFIYGSTESYFGRGLMTSSRRTWRRLQKLEDGMVIARLVRAYDKYLHKIPVHANMTPEAVEKTVKKYRDNITSRKVTTSDGIQYLDENPFNVETDFFMPEDGTRRGDIIALKSENRQLTSLEDMKWLRERMLARTKVPRHYMNLGTGNDNALTDGGTAADDVQFGRTLRQAQAVLRRGLIELGSFILFLKGLDAEKLGLRVIMTKVNTDQFLQESQVKFNLAQCAKIFATLCGGLPIEILAKSFMLLDTEQQAILKKWTEDSGIDDGILPGAQPPPPPGNSSAGSGDDPTPVGKTKVSKTSIVAKGGSGTTPRKQSDEMDKLVESLISLQMGIERYATEQGIKVSPRTKAQLRRSTVQLLDDAEAQVL